MITDEELRSAAASAAQKINDCLPLPYECTHQYSKSFEKQIDKIIQHLKHPIRQRIIQTAACFILIASLGFGSVMVVSADVREAVIEWIRCAYEDVYIYFTEGSIRSSATQNKRYTVTWVPDGYTLVDQFDTSTDDIYVFQNEQERFLSFQYMNASNGGTLMVEKGSGDDRQIEFDNHSADIYLDENPDEDNVLTWEIDNTLFCICGNLSEDELVQMAKSVVLVED